MTDWEAGQDLIAISDLISDKKQDLKKEHPEIYWMLDEVQRVIGDHFNRMKTHSFGLPSHDEESKSIRGGDKR